MGTVKKKQNFGNPITSHLLQKKFENGQPVTLQPGRKKKKKDKLKGDRALNHRLMESLWFHMSGAAWLWETLPDPRMPGLFVGWALLRWS